MAPMIARRTFLASLAAAVSAPLGAEEPPIDPQVLGALRVVEDADGFSNLRAGPSNDSKVLGRVPSGGVLAVDESSKSDWARAILETPDLAVYIHGSRLRRLEKWRVVRAGKAKPDTSARLISAGFEVSVSAAPFRAEKHVLTRNRDGMVRVDGRLPWGQDGGLPRNDLVLTVTRNGTAVKLPPEAVANLYEPSPGTLTLLAPASGGTHAHALFLMENGDGAGGYCVVWAFKDGRYLNRAVFNPY